MIGLLGMLLLSYLSILACIFFYGSVRTGKAKLTPADRKKRARNRANLDASKKRLSIETIRANGISFTWIDDTIVPTPGFIKSLKLFLLVDHAYVFNEDEMDESESATSREYIAKVQVKLMVGKAIIKNKRGRFRTRVCFT